MKTNKHPLTLEAARREYEQAMLRYALLARQERDTDALLAAHPPQPGEKEDLRPRVLRALSRGGALRDARRAAGRALPILARAAAVLLMIFAVGMPVAIAAVPPVRARVMELMFEMEREYTRVTLREKAGGAAEVPEGWTGLYYPSFVPQGYEAEEVRSASAMHDALYLREDGSRLFFTELGSFVSSRVDTENAQTSFVMVAGRPGMLIVKEGRISVVWSENDRYFSIFADNLSSETVMEMAESVVRIK